MSFDINNQYTGQFFGKDRIGHTTPDAEATETLRPWLPVSYPAPYLPTLRQDQGHPVLGSVVLTSQQLVGQDKSGALVPAGLFSGVGGTAAGHATGAGYCVLQYSAADVGFAYNAQTGVLVATAGETAVLGMPSNGVAGDVVTFPNGTTHTITAGDVTFATACTLFPAGVVKPIGCTIRNVFQYLGETAISSLTGGMLYTLNGVTPTKFRVHNYMHEMATAIQTSYVLRVPWIGATPTTLATIATSNTIAGYTQTDYSRSFIHFTGASGSATGTLHSGALVVGSQQLSDSGHYAPYNSAVHSIDDICGRVIGIQQMFPIHNYTNRVRTLWDPSRMTGPIQDPNPASIMMGGSATAGLDYQLNLGTNGLFKAATVQGKSLSPEMYTYVYVRILL
jgi:hypothetical protein